MKNFYVLILAALLILFAGLFQVVKNNISPAKITNPSSSLNVQKKSVDFSEQDIISYGQKLIEAKKARGDDLSSGPCLDNDEHFSGWVIDVAHSPRQPEDDFSQNQCSAYAQGRASHFLELSPDGVFIRSN